MHTFVCQGCGVTVEVENRYRASTRKYCSQACSHARPTTLVERTCTACGASFTTTRSEVRRGGGKYCTRECMYRTQHGENGANWRGGQVARACLNCGKTFYVDPNRVAAGRGKHCSRECYWQRARGPQHAAYRHGRGRFPYTGGFTKGVREKVILRDKVCVDCGAWDDRPRRMQVHHLDGAHDNHSLDNLVLLCSQCHRHRHHAPSKSSGNSASRVLPSAFAMTY